MKTKKMEESMMTYNKNMAIDGIKCEIYSQILTGSFNSR